MSKRHSPQVRKEDDFKVFINKYCEVWTTKDTKFSGVCTHVRDGHMMVQIAFNQIEAIPIQNVYQVWTTYIN